MMVGSFIGLPYRDCSRELTVFVKLKMVSSFMECSWIERFAKTFGS